jgi:hypothetical protein
VTELQGDVRYLIADKTDLLTQLNEHKRAMEVLSDMILPDSQPKVGAPSRPDEVSK